MNVNDLRNALGYLRRVVVGQNEVDTLLRTVAALEHELLQRTARSTEKKEQA